MVTKSRYVTPVYRGQGLGRRRRRNRRIIFILIAVLIILYFCFSAYSRKDDIKKTIQKTLSVESPKSFSAIQKRSGKFKFKWSPVEGAQGYTIYKYSTNSNKYIELRKFNGDTTEFTSRIQKAKYAVKSYIKNGKKYITSKKYTVCRFKTISDMIEIVGHRGALDQAPENTLASYKRAHEIGYQSFETDYFETDSNDLIICHDRDLSIFTNFKESIQNVTDSNRKDYPITKGINISRYTTQYLPTFEEAVQSASRHNMNIYLHTKNVDLTETAMNRIESIIKKYHMRNKATVFTPQPKLFFKLKKHDIRVGFLNLPNNTSDIVKAIDFAGKNKADILIMHYTKYLKKEHVNTAHTYNLKFGCYDTSDLKAAFKMVDFNVDFMITNKDFISQY